MQKFKLSVLGATCLCVVVVASFFVTQKTASASTNDGRHQPTSWERVDRAARDLKGGDPVAAGALVDAVFTDHGVGPEVSLVAPTIKDRLVKSEVDFQKGKCKGITEDKVAATVNQLADRLGAPDYGHTSTEEVKEVRLRMLTLFPNMIGRGPAATRDDSKPHFDKEMSPIEAFHVGATLIEQKVFNPEFQKSPQELQAAAQRTKGARFATVTGSSDGKRTHEMLDVIHRGAASMSAADMLNQCGKSLDLLGIER